MGFSFWLVDAKDSFGNPERAQCFKMDVQGEDDTRQRWAENRPCRRKSYYHDKAKRRKDTRTVIGRPSEMTGCGGCFIGSQHLSASEQLPCRIVYGWGLRKLRQTSTEAGGLIFFIILRVFWQGFFITVSK
jgi:hypothetical protein